MSDVLNYTIFWTGDDKVTGEDLLERCLKIVGDHIFDYIWHKEVFNLHVGKSEGAVLQGQIDFAESVEDEWFAISLLKLISKNIDEVVIKVEDDDGEILLIESADVLPKWAQEPDLAENRVYLHRNAVHLIPREPEKPSDMTPLMSGVPEAKDAAKVVSQYCNITLASPDVQKCISKRLETYPSEIDHKTDAFWNKKDQLHFTIAKLSPKFASILQKSPTLIASCVQRYLEMTAKSVSKLEESSPLDSEASLKTGISFTRCLYAMMKNKDIYPGKKSKWILPSRQEESFNYSHLGFKITCGLQEMINDLEKKSPGPTNKEEILKELCQGENDYDLLVLQRTLTDLNGEFIKVIECERPADNEDWLQLDEDAFEQVLMKHFHKENKVVDNLEDFLNVDSDMKGVEVLDENDVDEPLDINPDDLANAIEKLLGKIGNGKEDDDEDEDEDEFDEEYEDLLEEELSGSNVTFGKEEKDVLENLQIAMRDGSFDGPLKTLLDSMPKKK